MTARFRIVVSEVKPRYRGPDAGVLYALAVMIPLWLLAALIYWCVTR